MFASSVDASIRGEDSSVGEDSSTEWIASVGEGGGLVGISMSLIILISIIEYIYDYIYNSFFHKIQIQSGKIKMNYYFIKYTKQNKTQNPQITKLNKRWTR
jgi:hypothetical protein